jgi:hypothetical protein
MLTICCGAGGLWLWDGPVMANLVRTPSAAPRVTSPATRQLLQDAVLVAALLCVAAARSAFGSTVQRLMERWQEGGDAGGACWAGTRAYTLPLTPDLPGQRSACLKQLLTLLRPLCAAHHCHLLCMSRPQARWPACSGGCGAGALRWLLLRRWRLPRRGACRGSWPPPPPAPQPQQW